MIYIFKGLLEVDEYISNSSFFVIIGNLSCNR